MHSQRLVFVGPISPIKTGPSIYFDIFYDCVPDNVILNSQVLFVIDPLGFRGEVPSSYKGFPTITYEEYQHEDDDIVIISLANNSFHHHCWLTLKNLPVGARVVSVIHDLQCFMALRDLCCGYHMGLTPDDLYSFFEGEVGYSSFLRHKQDIEYGQYDFLFPFLPLGHALTTKKSQKIIVHSEYAKLKLVAESGLFAEKDILVAQLPSLHARVAGKNESHRSESSGFNIGMFGWVTPMKRLISALCAVRDLKVRVGAGDDKVHLHVVGELDGSYRDEVLSTIDALGLKENVKLYGFVSNAVLVEKMASMDLILNMRFPSCGETSGALNTAREYSIPIISTGYAAFSEAECWFKVSPGSSEVGELGAALGIAFSVWKEKGTTQSVGRWQYRPLSHSSLNDILSIALKEV